jgi:lysophospholipase L1-like esterase
VIGAATLHNVLVLRRTLLLVAALGAATSACGADGPPLAVATRASSIAETVERDIHVAADAATAEQAAAATDEAIDGSDHPAGGSGPIDGVDQVPATSSPVAAPGAVSGGVADPAVMPASAAVIGDSIALSAEPYVVPALESLGIEVVAYDAVENRRMVNGSNAVSSGRQAIRDVVEGAVEPDLWIVALGTNDVGALTGREPWEEAVEDVLATIPEGADVVWVDTSVRPLDEYAAQFNDTLRDEAQWRNDVWVLDWHGRAADDGLVTDDGVHLSSTGRIEYARMIADGLREIYD